MGVNHRRVILPQPSHVFFFFSPEHQRCPVIGCRTFLRYSPQRMERNTGSLWDSVKGFTAIWQLELISLFHSAQVDKTSPWSSVHHCSTWERRGFQPAAKWRKTLLVFTMQFHHIRPTDFWKSPSFFRTKIHKQPWPWTKKPPKKQLYYSAVASARSIIPGEGLWRPTGANIH